MNEMIVYFIDGNIKKIFEGIILIILEVFVYII